MLRAILAVSQAGISYHARLGALEASVKSLQATVAAQSEEIATLRGTATSTTWSTTNPAEADLWFVVFLSTDFSYHGHPTPLMPPNGRLRRSLSTYYYSMSTPPASECVNGDCDTRHEVLWKPLPPEVLGKECRRPPPA